MNIFIKCFMVFRSNGLINSITTTAESLVIIIECTNQSACKSAALKSRVQGSSGGRSPCSPPSWLVSKLLGSKAAVSGRKQGI